MKTEFQNAIDENNVKIVEEILRNTKTLTEKEYLFSSKIYNLSYPLHHASLCGYLDICKLLLDHGDDLERKQEYNNYTALYCAVLKNQQKTVEFLLHRGADCTIKTGRYNDTLLHTATLNGNAKICELLLKYGAVFSERDDRHGCTPLHYASLYGYTDISDILKKAGADMDIQDWSMKTPRMYEEDFRIRNDEFQKNRERYREIDTFGRFLPRV